MLIYGEAGMRIYDGRHGNICVQSAYLLAPALHPQQSLWFPL